MILSTNDDDGGAAVPSLSSDNGLRINFDASGGACHLQTPSSGTFQLRAFMNCTAP